MTKATHPTSEKPHIASCALGLDLRRFLLSAAFLTAVSLVIRTVGLKFNLYLADSLGTAGMGLIELIMSVWSFAVTFSSAGVSLAASRLCAEDLGRESGAGVRAVMKRCLTYSLAMGCVAGGVLLLLGEWIGVVWLGDMATVPALRLLALGLPCVAASSALGGYFSAVRRVGKNAGGQLLEVGVRIAITLLCIRGAGGNTERAFLGVVLGMTLSEVLSFLYQMILYSADLRRHITRSGTVRPDLTRKLLGVTLPVALSSYVRSGLVTLEHILIPRGLRRYGASYEESLAAYGVLSSMAMPILFFPASLLYAANGLLIPEIARAAMRKDEDKIASICRGLLYFTLLFGIGTAAILLCFSDALGSALYEDRRVGYYLGLLAPLIPVMYLDSAVDSLLKGLSEQVYCMGVNIADAALSALLVFFLVPQFGVEGYIGVIILSELINASLSISRLSQRVDLRPRLMKWVAVPLIAAVGATCTARVVMGLLFKTGGTLSLVCGMGLCAGLYLGLVRLLGGSFRPD